MKRIVARDLVVEFPMYGYGNRSVRNTFLRAATGGTVARDDANHLVVRALDRLNFEINDGDRIGLVGHNGSGKSTLLRVLAGAYEPVSGHIEVHGKVASMLSITLGMEPEATGYENIFLRAAVMGLTRRQTEPLVDQICDFADLGEYIHMPFRTYSSGMALRLGFAVSTAAPADIILMDEWLSVGDADFAAKAQKRLRDQLSRSRVLVLASHSESMVRDNCNRIFHLDHGRLEEVSVPAEPSPPRPVMTSATSGVSAPTSAPIGAPAMRPVAAAGSAP